MSTPIINSIPQWEWTLVSEDTTSFIVNNLSSGYDFYFTVRDTGETAPTAIVIKERPLEAVKIFDSQNEFSFIAQIPVDVYVYCFSRDNLITANGVVLIKRDSGSSFPAVSSSSGDGLVTTTFLDDNIVKGRVFNLGIVQSFIASTPIYFTSNVKSSESMDFLFLLPIQLSPIAGYVILNIYEGTEYTGGTQVSVSNRNRVVSTVSRLDILVGATGTNKGTLLPFSHVFGTEATRQSSGGGGDITANSIVLDTSKKYLYELTASETTMIGINAEMGEI